MSREIEVVNKKGRANLLFATLVCIPGPLVLAIDLAFGVNSTLIADLIKRSIDLLTVLLAWIIYELTIHNSITSETKARLEVFVKYFTGISMCVSGGIMIYVAIVDFGINKGDMIPSLFFAFTGAVLNVILYLNYRSMENPVLRVQAKLHRVKMLFDCGMVIILFIWILTSNDTVKQYTNAIGTAFISLYLVWSGFRLLEIPIFKKRKKQENVG